MPDTNIKKRILFIVNPISGSRRRRNHVELINDHVDRNKYDINIALTKYAGHAIEISRQAVKDKYDVIVIDEYTATGIKTFGILQVLLENNYLKDNTILILDEPEVHLHPKWQLEMAKVIVELVKNGVKIVVNSHSPYMIDALKYYADKSKVNSNFYLAQKSEDETSTINDVTIDISPIFEKLTEPLEQLHRMKLGLSHDDK
jgi:predicted ATPase